MVGPGEGFAHAFDIFGVGIAAAAQYAVQVEFGPLHVVAESGGFAHKCQAQTVIALFPAAVANGGEVGRLVGIGADDNFGIGLEILARLQGHAGFGHVDGLEGSFASWRGFRFPVENNFLAHVRTVVTP